ncbi:MAG: hypothetical protein JST80_06620 [Bdellovibrionales bacterium]|nr:hypothetical protein [Bdellovibrionales bacterium]
MKTRAIHRWMKTAIKLQLVAITMLFMHGCGIISAGGTSSSCTSGTVQLQVYEGMIKRICGCAESANATFLPGQNLQCTMSVGSQVHFTFINLSSVHTIGVQNGTPPTTGSYGPSSSTQTSVVIMNSTGTFTFTDIATGGAGTFIVN